MVGSIMAGYDGHRGWTNYLACDPNHRRQGIATALMDEARRLLLERGCPKVNLEVRVGNEAAASFYASLGYLDDEVTSFGMRLIQDG